jgi:hypothetical protein
VCSTVEEFGLDGGGSGDPPTVDKGVGAQVRLHDRDVGYRSSSARPLYGRGAAGLKSIVPV